MIRFHEVTKIYRTGGVEKMVADRIDLTFPPGRAVALIGRNGAGKSTLLQLIAGTMTPTSGHVEVTEAVSWPVGFSGAFHREMTGLQNTRFVARVYGVDSDDLVDFVEDVAGLGGHFRLPVRTYSQGMRARLAFAASMGIGFDTYLIDEISSVGDQSFRDFSTAMLRERVAGAGAVVVAHNMRILRDICDCGMVLEAGRLTWFDDIDEAIATHQRAMASA